MSAGTVSRAPRSPLESAVIVGLMSGTSADGIAAAAVRFTAAERGGVRAELLAHGTQPYTTRQRDRLLAATEHATPAELCALDFDLGAWLADAALAVIARAHLAPSAVRAIATHGHTLWHAPPHGTWQAGESAVIAERTGVDVVSDFRVRDVAAGGEGAPLVPIADALLFAAPGAWRALENLGGIGNVSIVPPAEEIDARDLTRAAPRGFDTGPGCIVIDGVTRALVPTLPYDVNGELARRGTAVASVVAELLDDPFFAVPPPKSTGRERFTRAYIARVIDACRVRGATTEDIVATAVELTAESIAHALRRFVPEPVREVVLSGGGARNPALVEAITRALAPLPVRSFDELFFDGDAKEAVAFALLGWLHLRRAPGNVVAVTGARGPRVLGKLCPA